MHVAWPKLWCCFFVQDFVEVLKHVLAPEGVFLMAHQIRRSVSSASHFLDMPVSANSHAIYFRQ